MARELLTVKEIAELYSRTGGCIYYWKWHYPDFPRPAGLRKVTVRSYAEVYDAREIAQWVQQRMRRRSSGQGQGQAERSSVAEEGTGEQASHDRRS